MSTIEYNVYGFEYEVPAHNDVMQEGGFKINVEAHMLPMCTGINPTVAIKFVDNWAAEIDRILSLRHTIIDCENIAVRFFKEKHDNDCNVMQPVATKIPVAYIPQLLNIENQTTWTKNKN